MGVAVGGLRVDKETLPRIEIESWSSMFENTTAPLSHLQSQVIASQCIALCH